MPIQKTSWVQIIAIAIPILAFALTVSSGTFASKDEVASLKTKSESDEERIKSLEDQVVNLNKGVASANAKLDLLIQRDSK